MHRTTALMTILALIAVLVPGLAFPGFVINGDGTVTDTATGLMWQRGTSNGVMNWYGAVSYCDDLSLSGYDDWRLPTSAELQTLFLLWAGSPKIDSTTFPDNAWGYYFSSTLWDADKSEVYLADFGNGWLIHAAKTYPSGLARAVRGGQLIVTGHLVISVPAKGNHWLVGSAKTITWDTASIAGNVAISLSRDGGKTYETIIASTPNDGSFNWTVTGPSSYNCALKIEPLSDPTNGTVQSLFTIEPDPNDTDADGLPDAWEQANFGNLSQTAGGDAEGDGLTNLQEYTAGTNPNSDDSDGDGMKDGWEVSHGLNPVANDAGADPDNDNFTNGREFQDGTDPANAASHYVLPQATGRLPDTGQTKCYDNAQEIPCPQEGQAFYGQDANYLINPPQYIKMDAQGRYLADSAVSWAMVYDVVTGLIWEMKTDDGSIHDKDNTYTWDDAQSVFIAGLNSANFGGHTDWRLPQVKELASIVGWSRIDPAINPDWFDNTNVSFYYWSSTQHAYDNNSYWSVFFNGIYSYYGAVNNRDKTNHYSVRAVRSAQFRQSGNFINNGDGTVTDSATGLMWQQADSGYANWETALNYCENLQLAGHYDWRMPTVTELQSIVDYSRYSPSINPTLFPGTDNAAYWSSSNYSGNNTSAWYFEFHWGGSSATGSSNGYVHARAVRSGQLRIPGNLHITNPIQASFFSIGQNLPITWDTAGISGDVGISLSRDGGKTYEVISASTPNDGAFDWTVTGPASVNCALKIEPLNDPSKATVQSLFTIEGLASGQPYIPSAPSPAHQATNVSIDADLSWTGDDPDPGDTVTYDVYFGTDSNPPLVSSAQSALTYSPWPMAYSQMYYWKIVAKDNNGNQSTSPVWSFTTIANPDSDSDTLPDSWETTNFGNLNQTAGGDADGDGLTNLQEYTAGTNPNSDDSDGDGMSDDWEIAQGLNPLADDAGADPDGDKFTNGREFQDGTDPTNAASHYVLPPVTGRIPDTGQTKCYDNTTEIPCPQEGQAFYGQDGNYLINPPQYIKMDAQGRYLADSAVSWAMVYDVVTGLIWEMKTDDGSIHDKDNAYTWDNAQSVFIAGLNSVNFGGQSDWRLPTVIELASIVDRGKFSPSINTMWFPNFPTTGLANWSSSASVSYNDYSWSVDFNYGYVHYYGKSNSHNVRAVRSGQSRVMGNLINNGDGTVTDSNSGLMWQQANPGKMTWEAGLSYCQTLTSAGYSDWRLPNASELQSIIDYSLYNPSTATTAFPGAVSWYTWSSSLYAYNCGLGWYVHFYYGDLDVENKSLNLYVRAVRSGQPKIAGNLYITSPLQAAFQAIGQNLPITWDTAGIGGEVTISLSRDGGKTYEVISASTPNDGAFEWTVTGPTSFNCALKIEPLADPSKATVQSLFTIKGPGELPYVPSVPFPANQATNISINTDLSWIGGDPDAGDTVTYDVYFGTDSNPPLVTSAQSDLTYSPSPMAYSQTYYWKIVAHDSNGNTTPGPIWSFTTFTPDTTAPTAPGNLDASPEPNAWTGDNTIEVTWTAATDNIAVAGYSYLWDTNPTTDPDATIETSGLSAISSSLSDGASHYFHVRAIDAAGNTGPTAHIGPFKIDTHAPSVWADPGAGSYNTSIAVMLESNDPNAAIYWSYYPTSPVTGGTYYLGDPFNIHQTTRILFYAKDQAGNASTVVDSRFTIDTIPPAIPGLPTDNLTSGDDPTPSFHWNAVADAHHYLFQWSANVDFTSPATYQVTGATAYTLATAITTGGRYYWRVAAVDAAGNQSAWTSSRYYDFIASNVVRKAVIVAGSGPTVFGGNLWPSTVACSDFVYTVLSHRGYWPERMAYLSHQTTAQNPNVDALATNANLQAGISQAANADELVVYFSGHGEPGLFRMGETEYLSAATLDGWLDAIQAAKPAMKLIVIYDACFAGSFVGPLQPAGTQNRIVITSADADQKAWFSANGTLSFSWLFWSHVDSGDDVKVSFSDAKNSVEYSYANSQTPLAEADGDGAANNKPDYNLMAGRFIGFDTVPGGAPVIGSAPADICLSGMASQVLQAQGVTGTSSLQRVWATILRPDTVLDDPENPGLGLPEVDLIDQGGGLYQGTYANFDIAGAYTVTLMAKDVQGLVSNPKITVVVKDPVTGDLNHSGAADLADAIIAAKAVSGMATGRTSPCEDVNGDGKAGMAELVHALQNAAGVR